MRRDLGGSIHSYSFVNGYLDIFSSFSRFSFFLQKSFSRFFRIKLFCEKKRKILLIVKEKNEKSLFAKDAKYIEA